jgi:pimeloyl-ACP methyl ester carboxylesterase
MKTVQSADGTVIAYDQFGDNGPPVILVAGAFNTRATTDDLARTLQHDCIALNFDRRGRGDSGDTAPYSVDREIEDLDAVIGAAGADVLVFGYSSGALLALRAAATRPHIAGLVLYEPPYRTSHVPPMIPSDLVAQLDELIAEGRRGDAVELYQTKAIGMPTEVVAQMRNAPFRPALEALAHTLAYEARLVGDLSLPEGLLRSVTVPTRVIAGENTSPFMLAAARSLAEALPAARFVTLPGQSHDIDPSATAPVVVELVNEVGGTK